MSEKISIYVDEPELEKVLLDLPNYIATLHGIILNSNPQYTVGIYGDWGTGKTTLMKNVMNQLDVEGVACLEFNAWRFAHEEQHATFPLMSTMLSELLINDKVKNQIDDSKNEALKNKIWRVVKGLKGSVTLKIPLAADFTLDIDPSNMTKEDSNTPDISGLINKSKPVLQEGLEAIQEILKYLEGPQINQNLRLVVFIDDLDRCTPEKATEIFESIKIFFDLPGIVFVLGLSQSIIEAAINYKYEKFKMFNGKDYLKKIISVPFPLPLWSEDDISKFIEGMTKKDINPEYDKFFQENKLLISQGIQLNPREVKRLFNNFILAHSILKREASTDMKKFLVSQIISIRWKEFYDLVSLHPYYISRIEPSGKNKVLEAMKKMSGGVDSPAAETQIPKPEQTPVEKYLENDKDLRYFLKNEGKIFYSISKQEWEVFRRATVIEPEIIRDKKLKQTEKLQTEVYPNADFVIEDGVSKIRKIPFWNKGGSRDQGKSPISLTKTFELDVNDSGLIIFQYHVPVDLTFGSGPISHSSDIKLKIKIDGKEILETEWMGHKNRNPPIPLKSKIIAISNLKMGKHFISLQPEVNENYLDNWGGTVTLFEKIEPLSFTEILENPIVLIPEGSHEPGCEKTGECFIPAKISIKKNQTITWKNVDTAAHTITSGSDGADGIFDSSLFMAGKSFSFKFENKGTFRYFCMVHPWQRGIVTVS